MFSCWKVFLCCRKTLCRPLEFLSRRSGVFLGVMLPMWKLLSLMEVKKCIKQCRGGIAFSRNTQSSEPVERWQAGSPRSTADYIRQGVPFWEQRHGTQFTEIPRLPWGFPLVQTQVYFVQKQKSWRNAENNVKGDPEHSVQGDARMQKEKQTQKLSAGSHSKFNLSLEWDSNRKEAVVPFSQMMYLLKLPC